MNTTQLETSAASGNRLSAQPLEAQRFGSVHLAGIGLGAEDR